MIKPAELEAAGQQQQVEAWYKELSADMNGQQQSNGYRRLYLQWLQQPMTPHAAYLQRSIMNIRAKCYLQVHRPLLLLSCLHAASLADCCIREMNQCTCLRDCCDGCCAPECGTLWLVHHTSFCAACRTAVSVAQHSSCSLHLKCFGNAGKMGCEASCRHLDTAPTSTRTGGQNDAHHA